MDDGYGYDCKGNGEANVAYTYNDSTRLIYSDEELTMATVDYEDCTEGTHDMTEHAAREATCTEAGNSAYWSCSECDKYFSDAAGTTEIEEDSWVIPAAGEHSWVTSTATVLGADGYTVTQKRKCSQCGEEQTVSSSTVAYKVSLPKVKVAKGKAGKKKLTAKWKKVTAKNKKKIGGIEIQVSGPGVNNVIYMAGKGKASKVIKGLTSKQKYKYRVRAYKGSGTAKEVSAWSGWKTVKIK